MKFKPESYLIWDCHNFTVQFYFNILVNWILKITEVVVCGILFSMNMKQLLFFVSWSELSGQNYIV